MSEEVKIVNSKNELKSIKRGKIEYIDFIMAFLNSIVIVYIFILINNRLLLLSIIGFFFIAILLIETIITFFNRNHFYIYFCYGLTLNGVLGDIFLCFINPIFFVLFLPISVYGYTIYQHVMYPLSTRRPYYQQTFIAHTPPPYITSLQNQKKELFEENIRKNIEKKFKFTSIGIISIFCSIGLLVTLIMSAII